MRRYRCIIGGDFYTELDRGWRFDFLREFCHKLGLDICNAPDQLHVDESWTFQSSVGVRRCIDYLLVCESIFVKTAMACNCLDLGSDHRAVRGCFEVPCARPFRPDKKTSTVGSGLLQYTCSR